MQFEKSTVHFEITTVCNHRCIFCYNQHQVFDSHSNQDYISIKNFKEIINKLVENKVENVILTGGEPLLHPEFKKIIDCITSTNLNVSINTNGTLLTPEMNEFLANKKMRLLVSMHGTGDLYEKLVGAKTFEKVKNNLINARKIHNLPISMQFVPLKNNFEHLYDVAKLGESLGCYVQVGRYTDPCGLTCETPEMGLTIDEYHVLFKSILDIRENLNVKIGLGNGIPLCMVNQRSISNDILNLFNRCGCSLGKSTWAMNPKGDIRGCPQLDSIIGNILKDSIENLSSKIDELYEHKLIIPNECQECQIKIICSGGCRASGLLGTGLINAVDPLFQHNENNRNTSIKQIEEKIKKIAETDKKPLKKPLNDNDILKFNHKVDARAHGESLILRGFGSKGFIYKKLNETAKEILKKFYQSNTIDSALLDLAKDFSIGVEDIKQDVYECITDLVKMDILQIVD